MSGIDLEAIRRSYENWTVGLAVCPQPHGPCITCQPRANDAARHIPALLALVDELRAGLAELAQARAVIDATRQMAIDANARLRAQLLTALGLTDDGRTSLSAYVSHLTAQRDALKASLAKADTELDERNAEEIDRAFAEDDLAAGEAS